MMRRTKEFRYVLFVIFVVGILFLDKSKLDIYIDSILSFDYMYPMHSDTISCNALPIAIPTDNEKRYVYTKYFHKNIDYEKGVFLTLDDGPSKNTLKILDILKENNIKATFFIVGKAAEKHPEIIRKLNDSGMCILTHSYSHEYGIYKSLDAYFKDLYECNEVITKLTNKIPAPYIRFPGGSSNTVGNADTMRNIKELLKRKNVKYIDWNVSSADAAESVVAMAKIRNNVVEQSRNKNVAVVLMHDAPTKTTTADALPDIIKFYKENDYVFRTFNDMTDAEEKELVRRKIINK